LLAAIVLVLSACASAPPVPEGMGELWRGKVSGDFDGEIEFRIVREKGTACIFSLLGDTEMFMPRTAYGRIRVHCKLKGKVKKGILEAQATGRAYTDEGNADVRGKFIGTMSRTQAFGSWMFTHEEGQNSGEWSAERVE